MSGKGQAAICAWHFETETNGWPSRPCGKPARWLIVPDAGEPPVHACRKHVGLLLYPRREQRLIPLGGKAGCD